MDDERIERALRAGPADEPRYAPLGLPAPSHPRRIHQAALRGAFEVLAAVGLVAVVVSVVVFPTILRGGPQVGSPPDVLAAIHASGRIRIAVTSGSPQVRVPGSGIDGFDLDVARAIGQRLGVSVEIEAVDPSLIEAGGWGGRWDLALDSAVSTARRATALEVGEPYYVRTAAVVVPDGSSAASLADLAGAAVCTVRGSLAERWVAGSLDLVNGTAAVPPPRIRPVSRDTADACLAALGDGSAMAYIADWTMDVDPPGAGLVRLSDVPFTGAAGPAVDRGEPGSDTLLAEVDRIVASLRGDGTLRGLAERRFGGRDLTIPPGG